MGGSMYLSGSDGFVQLGSGSCVSQLGLSVPHPCTMPVGWAFLWFLPRLLLMGLLGHLAWMWPLRWHLWHLRLSFLARAASTSLQYLHLQLIGWSPVGMPSWIQ